MHLPELPGFFRVALRAIECAGRDPALTAWVGAVIVRGGAVIGSGANRIGTNTFVHRTWPRHRTACVSVHAEIDAIFKTRRRVDLRGCRMYVVRVTRAGITAGSRPCTMCMDLLGRYGFTDVNYTVDGGGWTSEVVPHPRWIRTTRRRRSQLRAKPSK